MDEIIEMIETKFNGKIDKNTYLYIKELWEYVDMLYDGSVTSEDFSDTSSEDISSDESEESYEIAEDKEGFKKLK
tara:strand:- start:1318 stop:1542 length:225 start_codon:yes stop_codon:yes gene_type:complete